jgi:cellulose synthase/poly-beta-1,6-N-acetylglucosamine synthase-like glycosyltransferase
VIVLDYILVAVALLLLVPSSVLIVQVVAAMLPVNRTTGNTMNVANTEVCLLMPAHNEASGIVPVIQALIPQLTDHIRLLVVADNCSDQTAALVRELGIKLGDKVQVIERYNTELRGKGYALHFGVQHLASDPPGVVIVVDADCSVGSGSIATLTQHCLASQRPVQALYLMQSSPEQGVRTRLAEFAWVVKNKVRPLGFHRLGLPCQLMGTGMAFTWEQICNARLNTGHIAEDMQLGVDLARAGTPPLFCPEALVTSFFPTSVEGLQTQRRRWEHGHLGVIVTEVPKLLFQAVASGNPQLLALALDLCLPPLALLTLLLGALLLTSAAWAMAGVGVLGSISLVLSAFAFCVLASAVLLAWRQFGRAVISFRQLCGVPLYVLKKVPLYVYFVVKRQAIWVRSKREGE